MGRERKTDGSPIAKAVASAGVTIYDPLDSLPEFFFDIEVLEETLRDRLRGLNLAYPLRTRSKVAKEAVCRALGYPVPLSFKRVRPRFPGQDLDIYVQKSNNLQIWNEEIDPTRRYAIIRLAANDRVADVRVVTGEALARLDKTGTLTSKYQARRRPGNTGSALVSDEDTENLLQALQPAHKVPLETLAKLSPLDRPRPGAILTIEAVYDQMQSLCGNSFRDPGLDQERFRGEAMHRLACNALGLSSYADHGQFPDILCQALEIKFQLSPTIDLGLVAPDSDAPAEQVHPDITHQDIRYAIFYGTRLEEDLVEVESVVVSPGQSFFKEFQRFEGLVQNAKLQIRLPDDFFNSE